MVAVVSGTLSGAVLALSQQLAAGVDESRALGFALEQALQATQDQLEASQQDALHHPELSPDLAVEVVQRLHNLKDCFLELKSHMSLPAGSSWAPPCERLELAIEGLQQCQREHQQRLTEGPTSHVFLNRLLLHLSAWQKGRTLCPATRVLAEAIPEFTQELNSLLDPLEDAFLPILEELLARVTVLCEEIAWAVKNSQASPAQLEQWPAQLIQLSIEFDRALLKALDSGLSAGPTSLGAVNLVLAAAERWLHHEISTDTLVDTLDHCEALLHDQLLQELCSAVAPVAQEIFSKLQDIRSRVEAGLGEEVERDLDQLCQITDRVAQQAELLTRAGPILDLVSGEGLAGSLGEEQSSLPVLLSQILQCAQAYGDGIKGKSDLRKAMARLEDLIDRSTARFLRSSGSADLKEQVAYTLDLLAEACEHLQGYVAQPEPGLLTLVEELFWEASDRAAEFLSSDPAAGP